MAGLIPRRVVPSSRLAPASPRQVAREFRGRLQAGARLRPAGEARRDPPSLLSRGYTPRFRVDLFDVAFYLTHVRQNADIRFFVAYVVLDASGRGRAIYPRIFYKDLSLVWRSASHFVQSDQENWIGKGDLRELDDGDGTLVTSDEATTDLPLEIQTALEGLVRLQPKVRTDEVALGLVLRRGGDSRLAPYADFTAPRRRAQADPRNRIHRGHSIARFTTPGDPTSLRFARGYAPDFGRGVVELATSTSRLYGGELQRFRVLSQNRQVQFLFIAAPHQAWIASCQATTTELSSYGVRTIDVRVDDDLLVPGYEYHYLDDSEDPPVWVSQIPPGYAGPPSDVDDYRCDASAWLERLPVIREFRRRLLPNGRRARAS